MLHLCSLPQRRDGQSGWQVYKAQDQSPGSHMWLDLGNQRSLVMVSKKFGLVYTLIIVCQVAVNFFCIEPRWRPCFSCAAGP